MYNISVHVVVNVTCTTLINVDRVFKQTLRSAGGNLTQKHVENVSLCALFLMEASKKADKFFKVPKYVRQGRREDGESLT